VTVFGSGDLWRMPVMTCDILLPLPVELLGESLVRFEAGFDFFLATPSLRVS
jgi:hypothetical protein